MGKDKDGKKKEGKTEVDNEKTKDSEQNKADKKEKDQCNSQIKIFVEEFLKTGQVKNDGDAVTADIDLSKKDKLILEIYETFPLFLCHDGYFFINVVFTKSSWEKLRDQVAEKNMKLSDMLMYRLGVSKFKL